MSLVITAADRSGRWYLLPGTSNSYDLAVANESDHAVLCKLTLDEPGDAGAVSPSSLTLKGGESRNVSVAFKPEWLTLRDRKAVVTARDAAGTVLATFVNDLVAATATDCSVSLAWKDEIGGDGGLRGFILACTVRSISSMPGIFEPEFTPHPSLRFPEKQRITLGPGESSTFDVPIVWNRSSRDVEGWNHPRSIEVSVPVTHGRRSANAPWDIVQHHIEPYLTDADKSPVIARRPPPPQFTQPGGAPAVSTLAVTQIPEPTPAPPVTGSHSARIEQAEMDAGVVVTPRGAAPAPPGHPQPAQAPAAYSRPADRETIAVSPSTLLLIALAVGAIAVALVWIMRTPSGTSAVSTAPVPIASSAIPSAPAGHKHKAPLKRPSHATSAPVVSTAQSDTSAAQAAQSSGSSSSSATAAPQPRTRPAQTQRASAPRVSPVDRSALVQIGDVGAEYMRGGRQVHIFWNSYAQAHAEIQVLDSRSTLLASTIVGRREAALLSLPRNYRGDLYIEVTAIGYDGTRVLGTTSLGSP